MDHTRTQHIKRNRHPYFMFWQVKDIESKLRQRNTVHSISDQNDTFKDKSSCVSQTLTRTTSSGSVNQKFSSPNPPNPLLKSKSSTFISPDQNESPMYNTKVTLRLRRSNSHLNTSHKNGFSNNLNGADHESGSGINNEISRNPKPYYFGAHPSHSHQGPADIFSAAHQLPKPPLPPSCSKPILQRTVNIYFGLC